MLVATTTYDLVAVDKQRWCAINTYLISHHNVVLNLCQEILGIETLRDLCIGQANLPPHFSDIFRIYLALSRKE